jgi:hypothetical protein
MRGLRGDDELVTIDDREMQKQCHTRQQGKENQWIMLRRTNLSAQCG